MKYLKCHLQETPATVEQKLRGEGCNTYLVAINEAPPPKTISLGGDGRPRQFYVKIFTASKEFAIAQRAKIVAEQFKQDNPIVQPQTNFENLKQAGFLHVRKEDVLSSSLAEKIKPQGPIASRLLIKQMQELPIQMCVHMGYLKYAVEKIDQDLIRLSVFHKEARAFESWLTRILQLTHDLQLETPQEAKIIKEVVQASVSARAQIHIWLGTLHLCMQEKGSIYKESLKALSKQIPLEAQHTVEALRSCQKITVYLDCFNLLRETGVVDKATVFETEVLYLLDHVISLDSPEGLPNIGNSCYLNAGLQLLMAIPPFQKLHTSEMPRRQRVTLDNGAVKLEHEADYKVRCDLFGQLQLTVQAINSKDQAKILEHMHTLRLNLFRSMINPEFTAESFLAQHDTSAFLSIVFYAMGFDFVTQTKRTFTYQGHTYSQIQRPELKTLLSLPFSSSDSFEKLMKKEHVQALTCESDWKPMINGDRVEIAGFVEDTLFDQLPKHFVIQLQRFTNQMQKNTENISFDNPEQIDLSYLSQDKAVYHVSSFILHDGETCHEGHYRACRLGEDHLWRLYDDKQVSVLNAEQAKELMGQAYIVLLTQNS
jgi:hypothetical protein